MRQLPDIPYTPRIPVEDDRIFKNYRREINEIESSLQQPGIAYALVGGPGMAKSSILKRIKRDLLKTSSSSPNTIPSLIPIYLKLVTPNFAEPKKLRALCQQIMDQILAKAHRNVHNLEFENNRLRIHRLPANKIVDEDYTDFINDLWE